MTPDQSNHPPVQFLWKLPQRDEWGHYLLYSAIAGVFFLCCYYGAWWISQFHDYRVSLPELGGQWLPFHPAWTVAYISIMLAHTLAPFSVASRKACTAWAMSLCYCVTLATLVFVFFPSEQPSIDHLKQSEEFLIDLYWATSALSTSGNAFPSLHVDSMLCTVWYSSRNKPVWFKTVLGIWFLLVVYSTVVLRLHYIVDIGGGAFIAVIAIRLSNKLHL